MVRDDFWLAVSRFMLDLEVDLVPGRNIALADLFDLDHARRILAALGRAFGRLPENRGATSREQKDFLKQVVSGLAEEGKVVCVRLAVFAEMMKGKPWTLAALKEVGGTQGIGVTFLEETFSRRRRTPSTAGTRRRASVLKALLPESGSDLKGHMRSYKELLAASGYADRIRDFDELIRIFDNEVRLITPTEVEVIDPSDFASQGRDGGEILPAHPRLPGPFAAHLADAQTERNPSWPCGAALMERSSAWNAQPENRHLPSVWEWGAIRALTEKRSWTAPQRQMMGKAGQYHALRGAVIAALLAVVGWTPGRPWPNPGAGPLRSAPGIHDW